MITRRKLLALSGLTIAGAGTAGLFAVQPRRRRIDPSNPSAAEKFGKETRVAVVGGGLAGLSAALELAERGANVTLFEAASHFGGKLGGWPVQVLGETHPMEHGFHGFFAQYYNFKDVLARIDGWKTMRPALTYPLLSRDKGEEIFQRDAQMFPFNLLELYTQSKNLKFAPLLKAGPRMQALLDYDPVNTYTRFDNIDFTSFCKDSGMDPALAEMMLLPFAKTTLNRPEVTSAAHVLRFMHFYFLGNPEGLSYHYLSVDSMTAVIDPWVARLRMLGVDLRPSTPVQSLMTKQGRCTGVVLRSAATSGAMLCKVGTLSNRPLRVLDDFEGAPVYAWKNGDETIAVRGACTHQGCPIAATDTGFACPCHGGRFNLQGEPVAGPPKRALDRLLVKDGAVFAPVQTEETFLADYVVVASDAAATQRLTGAALGVADPYLIVRLWLDKRSRPDRAGFYTTTGYDLLDAVAVYENLHPFYSEYAQRTGRGVVELHAYAISPDHLGSLDENIARLYAEFLHAFPELRDAKVLHQEAQQQQNFSGFGLGSHASRPGTESEIENLYYAGDWVKSDLPIALMEAAVTTGRLASNAICRKEGVREAAIETVAARGVLAPLST